MKKIFSTLFICLCIFINANAKIFTVSVSNFQFSPSTVNANVGDTIKWVWVNGFHTTTSRNIPAGASSWDAPIQGAGQTFSYKLTVTGTYNYWCAIHTTEMEATLKVGGSLAVTFNDFNISSTIENNVLLKWQTLSETNTSYYSVRRSYDAKDFAEIAKVTAAGNSSGIKSYQYTDALYNKSVKYIYYCIAVINKDGSTQLSDIKMFQNNFVASKLITSLSPNPVTNGHLMLQFNADRAGEMSVKVFDVSGKLILATQMSAIPGLNNGHLHLMDVASGSYKIIFELNGIKETHTIFMQ